MERGMKKVSVFSEKGCDLCQIYLGEKKKSESKLYPTDGQH